LRNFLQVLDLLIFRIGRRAIEAHVSNPFSPSFIELYFDFFEKLAAKVGHLFCKWVASSHKYPHYLLLYVSYLYLKGVKCKKKHPDRRLIHGIYYLCTVFLSRYLNISSVT
jgi:hypothetical protein